MKSQFISSRDIAQRLEMIRQPGFDTPARRGDELTLPRIAQELIDGDRAALRATTVREDLQATRRRPLDAPMASWSDDVREREAWADKTNYALDDVVPSLGLGRAILTLLLMATGFVAGFVIGRW